MIVTWKKLRKKRSNAAERSQKRKMGTWVSSKVRSLMNSENKSTIKESSMEREGGGKIGGSRVNCRLHLGETPTQSTEDQSEQPTAPQYL